MFRTTLALICAVSLVATPALAQAPKPPAPTEAAADAAVKSFQGFTGAVLVAKDGKVVFRKGYGLANREWNIANTPETKFRLGSLTKAFTAVAILQLQEQGKLSVDDPVSKYYADAPAAWSKVTIKHLLTHRSGIPSYTNDPSFIRDMRMDKTPLQLIAITKDKPLEFEPGSKFNYDNSGYILLGYIIEHVTSQPYADYIDQHIFKPLGMTNSGYDRPDAVIVGRASGYELRPNNDFVNAAYLAMSQPYAAGSLYSTVDDMLKWDQALKTNKLISAASTKAMFTDWGDGYGYGFGVSKTASGHTLYSHTGGINGFATRFDRYPDDGLTVVVLSNLPVANTGGVTSELAALYLGNPPRTAAPGGAATVTKALTDLRAGTPDYAKMSDSLAATTKAQLAGIQRNLGALGAIKSVKLLHADANGMDRYLVTFEKGALEYAIAPPGPDGKVAAASMRQAIP